MGTQGGGWGERAALAPQLRAARKVSDSLSLANIESGWHVPTQR